MLSQTFKLYMIEMMFTCFQTARKTQIKMVFHIKNIFLFNHFSVIFKSNMTKFVSPIQDQLTRVNNVSQSARLFTFYVLDQSECVKLTTCQQKERENNTLFYVFRAIRYCILYSGTERL